MQAVHNSEMNRRNPFHVTNIDRKKVYRLTCFSQFNMKFEKRFFSKGGLHLSDSYT